ncbi:MAG TPA: DUF721 domain-containing protein [Bacteroidaceae bacterium]|nr:DUF721 domain-containing protein [Bacteroidaceae bacterium]
MKKTRSRPISDVVYQYLRESGLETPLNEFRLVQAWNTILGNTVSRYTTNLKIYNQVLYVNISSAALKNELMMKRTALVKRLNESVGAQVIVKIVIK